jgi:hypothetical protein
MGDILAINCHYLPTNVFKAGRSNESVGVHQPLLDFVHEV